MDLNIIVIVYTQVAVASVSGLSIVLNCISYRNTAVSSAVVDVKSRASMSLLSKLLLVLRMSEISYFAKKSILGLLIVTISTVYDDDNGVHDDDYIGFPFNDESTTRGAAGAGAVMSNR